MLVRRDSAVKLIDGLAGESPASGGLPSWHCSDIRRRAGGHRFRQPNPALSVETSLLNHPEGSPPACFVQEVDDGVGNKS